MTYNKGSIGDFFAWTMTVAKDPKRAGERPKQWFESDATAKAAHGRETSPEAMIKLLSEENLGLLKLMATREFASLRELAESARRKESNLSVTLRKLMDAGIVTLERGEGRSIRPRLVAERVTLDLDLMGKTSAVSVRHPAH